MYTKYVWKAGATAANVLADLTALLTATEPDVSALSADCDKALTTILANTVKSNWTVFDPAASATSKALRSLNADGVTYKFVQLSVTSTLMGVNACEGFNAVSHTAVNGLTSLYFNPSVAVNINFTNPGYVFLIATNRYIGIFNSPLVSNNKTLVFEFERTSPNIDSTYPCIVQFSNNTILGANSLSGTESNIVACRYKDPSQASGDLVTSNTAVGHLLQHIPNPKNPTTYAINQQGGAFGIGGVKQLMLLPIYLIAGAHGTSQAAAFLGEILGNVRFIHNPGFTYSNGDSFVKDDTAYIMIDSGVTPLLVPEV